MPCCRAEAEVVGREGGLIKHHERSCKYDGGVAGARQRPRDCPLGNWDTGFGSGGALTLRDWFEGRARLSHWASGVASGARYGARGGRKRTRPHSSLVQEVPLGLTDRQFSSVDGQTPPTKYINRQHRRFTAGNRATPVDSVVREQYPWAVVPELDPAVRKPHFLGLVHGRHLAGLHAAMAGPVPCGRSSAPSQSFECPAFIGRDCLRLWGAGQEMCTKPRVPGCWRPQGRTRSEGLDPTAESDTGHRCVRRRTEPDITHYFCRIVPDQPLRREDLRDASRERVPRNAVSEPRGPTVQGYCSLTTESLARRLPPDQWHVRIQTPPNTKYTRTLPNLGSSRFGPRDLETRSLKRSKGSNKTTASIPNPAEVVLAGTPCTAGYPPSSRPGSL